MKTTYIERTKEQTGNLVKFTLKSLGELAIIKDKRELTEHEKTLMNEWLIFVNKNIDTIF